MKVVLILTERSFILEKVSDSGRYQRVREYKTFFFKKAIASLSHLSVNLPVSEMKTDAEKILSWRS